MDEKKSYCHNALMTYCLIPVGWAFQPNGTKERTGGRRERAESGVRDARNSFSASRARKAGIIIRQWREARKDGKNEKPQECINKCRGGGGLS